MSEVGSSAKSPGRVASTAKVIVVSSVMFSFISCWRTAAVVLCDMSSTVYYIGAIVESAIGQAAPWFILAVLLFSYAMRSVYIESCSLFVRGGVYRVVKEAMGGFLAKLSVSALLFDYVLTGPISGVSAGQYIVGLALETLARVLQLQIGDTTQQAVKAWGSVTIACGVTLYFLRQNLLGIHESSGKALKIMMATTAMAVVMLAWSGVTLAERGTVNPLPAWQPDLNKKTDIDAQGNVVPKINAITGEQEDPLGWLGTFPSVADPLRNPANWLSWIGVMGIVIAFGHSILAMSGEETLAQVYREVESPKLPNFRKAALTVFVYSLLLTGTFNFLAVLLVPHAERMHQYYDNWIGGLAMHLVGPLWLTLLLNGFVVVVGFLILSGAVNTSIVGSNGVLSRVAEDGVLPDWFLKPHRRYGTNYRVLYLIAGLQILTIVVSRGDMILLGETYAFGVVWSFVFKTLSMVVLRFKDRTPREFMVPLNVRWGSVHLPIGLGLVFLVVLLAALANFVTKPMATLSGSIFTAVFLVVFIATETYHHRRRCGERHEHTEQFNRAAVDQATSASLSLTKTYRKVVAIRSPQNLFMLEKALADTDPQTTEVIVMTAKNELYGGFQPPEESDLDAYDRELMTAVVNRAERLGKRVVPLIVRTNNPLYAVVRTAKQLGAQELVIGLSNKYSADEQLDQIALYWFNVHSGRPAPLTVRILGRERDLLLDLAGGNRIPPVAERQAKTVAELRGAGVGVDRVLMVHDGTAAGSDLFESVLTALDPSVALAVVGFAAVPASQEAYVERDCRRAEKLGRQIRVLQAHGHAGSEIPRLAREGKYDLIVVPFDPAGFDNAGKPAWWESLVQQAHCRVFLATTPQIPHEIADG